MVEYRKPVSGRWFKSNQRVFENIGRKMTTKEISEKLFSQPIVKFLAGGNHIMDIEKSGTRPVPLYQLNGTKIVQVGFTGPNECYQIVALCGKTYSIDEQYRLKLNFPIDPKAYPFTRPKEKMCIYCMIEFFKQNKNIL